MILVPHPLAKILLTLEDRENSVSHAREAWLSVVLTVTIHGQWVLRLVAKKFHELCLLVDQNLLYLFIYKSFGG